jgi:hypothetical protein
VIDEMTLDNAEEIFSHWEQTPPTYQVAGIIAQILGWQPRRSRKGDAPSPQTQQAEIAELLARPPDGMPVVRGGTGMPAPVFDLDEMRERNREKMAKIQQSGEVA